MAAQEKQRIILHEKNRLRQRNEAMRVAAYQHRFVDPQVASQLLSQVWTAASLPPDEPSALSPQ